MTANIHQHEASKPRFEVKIVGDTAWISIIGDNAFDQLTLFFNPKDIAHIMGQVEKLLGELETIAAHLDRNSDGELAPAGVSEQDGVAV